MAKQKINPEDENTTAEDTQNIQTGEEKTNENTNQANENVDEKINEENKKPKADSKNEKAKSATLDITPFIDNVLKNYPDSEYLYVDNHGGCFTQDTPERIRGKATLFKNPHYKS